MTTNQATKVGVIIARFQTPELHEAHKAIIDYVLSRHQDVIIFLGVSKVKLSLRDSLDFATRELMLNEFLKTKEENVKILALNDNPRRNDLWSADVDNKIETFFPDRGAVLYGSRDSFIPYYSGRFETHEMPELPNVPSGTELRKKTAETPRASADFRAGVIYACHNKYPLIHTTVDVAIFNDDESELLLGRKWHDPIEPVRQYRFVGGFVDINDENEIQTARREGYEETNGEVEPYEFVTSMMVRNDPRYKKEPDQAIMTHLYKARYVSGHLKGSDDLAEVKWFKLSELSVDMFVSEHQPLFLILKSKLNSK